MNREIKISLDRLEALLNQQKRLVVEKLLSQTSYYNKESTDGHFKSLPIDKIKFEEVGMEVKLPDDVEVLKRYLS